MRDFFIHLKEVAEIGFKLYLAVGANLNGAPVRRTGDQCFGKKFSDRDFAVRDGVITDICNTLAIIGKNLSDQIAAANQGTRGKAGLDARCVFGITAVRADAEVAFIFHAAHAQILVHPFHSFLFRAETACGIRYICGHCRKKTSQPTRKSGSEHKMLIQL